MGAIYTADFETTTDPQDCRVWSWGTYNIYNEEFRYSLSIHSFFKHVFKKPSATKFLFHNLKFDGSFLLDYLLKNDFEHVETRKLEHRQFTTLIDGKNTFFSLSVKWKNRQYYFMDSLKVIPLGIERIPKAFGLDVLKGNIDYDKTRPVGYKPTKIEVEYLKHDVVIAGKALRYFYDQELKKMTQASNAFNFYSKLIGKKRFERLFPVLDLYTDELLRFSYRGGWTYVKDDVQGYDIDEGIVYDVNSLYPWVMRYKKLPYGEPIYYRGQYITDTLYDLYVQRLRCQFELKPGKLPMLQIKGQKGFSAREYAKDSRGEDVELTLTSVDLKLFRECYELYNVQYHDGWKFKSSNKMFTDYVDHWTEVKIKSQEEGNEGMRSIAKLMLNALYGRFALNPNVSSKIPYLDDAGVVQFETVQQEPRAPIYLPVATFITAYSREKTISAAIQEYDRFCYADTDSIHLKGREVADIDIHPSKLGAWKEEYQFKKARFVRAKSYIEVLDDDTSHVACAGLPHRCHTYITYDNFKNGLEVPESFLIDDKSVNGSLKLKRVSGGSVLIPRTYKLTL